MGSRITLHRFLPTPEDKERVHQVPIDTQVEDPGTNRELILTDPDVLEELAVQATKTTTKVKANYRDTIKIQRI